LVVPIATGSLHFFLPFASKSVGVEDTSVTAAVSSRFPLDAKVEELAIIWIGMPRVLVDGLDRGVGTPELEQVPRSATLPVSLVTVSTLSLHRVKDEPSRTGDCVWIPVYAEVEFVTDRFIRVGKIAMLSRATWGWLRRLQLVPPVAVDGKREPTARPVINVFVKDESIRAEMLRYHSVVTFIIAITLQGVRKESVILRTLRHVIHLAKSKSG